MGKTRAGHQSKPGHNVEPPRLFPNSVGYRVEVAAAHYGMHGNRA